jgi:hypothetical protein
MKMLISALGLLVVLAIVGLLARKQLTAVTAPLPGLPELAGTQPGASQAAPSASPQQQTQQVQQAVQGIMQQARPMPEGK